jgi:hypothetical protein
MKVKTSEAKDQMLNYLVAKAEGIELSLRLLQPTVSGRAYECGSKNVSPIQPIN